MDMRTGKDKLASLFLLGNTVCLSSSKQALSSNDMQRRLVLFHLTNSLVIMLKMHWGKRQPIFLHFPSPYLTCPCLIMIPGLPVIFLRVLMPSLPHFPFLHKENTDKVQKIGTQHVLQARLKYSTSGTYKFAPPDMLVGSTLGWGEFCLTLTGQQFFRTDVMGPF